MTNQEGKLAAASFPGNEWFDKEANGSIDALVHVITGCCDVKFNHSHAVSSMNNNGNNGGSSNNGGSNNSSNSNNNNNNNSNSHSSFHRNLGGLCTVAFLDAIQQSSSSSWFGVLQHMRYHMDRQLQDAFSSVLNAPSLQIPLLTCSRWLDVEQQPTTMMQNNGRKRALLIGIHYTHQPNISTLHGCHDDVFRMLYHLQHAWGFAPQDCVVLMDQQEEDDDDDDDDDDDNDNDDETTSDYDSHDGSDISGDEISRDEEEDTKQPPKRSRRKRQQRLPPPTRRNILHAMTTLVQESKPGDILFFHYSGHGEQYRQRPNQKQQQTFSSAASVASVSTTTSASTCTTTVEANNNNNNNQTTNISFSPWIEALVPIDFDTEGYIGDDTIRETLVKPLLAGVTLTCLMDYSHAGNPMDLPYHFRPDQEEMQRNYPSNNNNNNNNNEMITCKGWNHNHETNHEQDVSDPNNSNNRSSTLSSSAASMLLTTRRGSMSNLASSSVYSLQSLVLSVADSLEKEQRETYHPPHLYYRKGRRRRRKRKKRIPAFVQLVSMIPSMKKFGQHGNIHSSVKDDDDAFQEAADNSNNNEDDDMEDVGGGLVTTSFLCALQHRETTNVSLLLQMQRLTPTGDFIPQLTSSRPIDIYKRFEIVPSSKAQEADASKKVRKIGTKRALLIGIGYNQDDDMMDSSQLLDRSSNSSFSSILINLACKSHADVQNVMHYLRLAHGFEQDNMSVLVDGTIMMATNHQSDGSLAIDSSIVLPTRENILKAVRDLVALCEPGDVVFFLFSGRGGSVVDEPLTEDKSRSTVVKDTIYPLDVETAGPIDGDELHQLLIKAMPVGVHMTCLLDFGAYRAAAATSTAAFMELPYRFHANNDQAKRYIPATIRMISGCRDDDDDALQNNSTSTEGLCTRAFLQAMLSRDVSWVGLLEAMRRVMVMPQQHHSAIVPQLSSSRIINIKDRVEIVPNIHNNTNRRAVLIGINYVGRSDVIGELSGSHDYVARMRRYLSQHCGFLPSDFTVLMDDGEHRMPTRGNMMDAFKQLVRQSKPGDSAFVYFTGHGGQIEDPIQGDEEDGYDEALIPFDFDTADVVRDDDLSDALILPLAEGVTMTCLIDSSTVLMDLPFCYRADRIMEEKNHADDNDDETTVSTVVGDKRRASLDLSSIANILKDGFELEKSNHYSSSNLQSLFSSLRLKDEEVVTS